MRQTKRILFAIFIGLLVGCTPVSYSQLQSENRAQAGIDRKLAAERQAIAIVTGSADPSSQRRSIEPILLLESVRLGLADDARADYRAATSPWFNATDQDRIVSLSRAGRKLWYAGTAADDTLTIKIRDAGVALCAQEDGQIAVRVPRDCELIEYFPLLTAFQKSQDTILDINLETTLRLRLEDRGLSDDEAAILVKAIVDMDRVSAEVAAASTQRSDIQTWLTREQVVYYCGFSQAVSLLGLSSSPQQARDAASQIQRAATQNSAGLQDLLAAAGVEQSQLIALYARYSDRIKALPGADGLNIGGGPASDHAACKKFQPPL